jgi:hypothetical protein
MPSGAAEATTIVTGGNLSKGRVRCRGRELGYLRHERAGALSRDRITIVAVRRGFLVELVLSLLNVPLRDMPPTPQLPAPLELTALRRRATPLRIALLHAPVAGGGPGPLAEFVRQRRAVALDLLLLSHAVWPLSSPDPIVASSTVWARALGLAERPGSRASISRSWTWLEDRRLVSTSRAARARSIRILCEDGSGRAWQHPVDETAPYFQLPHAYWESGLHIELGLAAKAVLLIGLSIQRDVPYFELPLDRGSTWYGLSERTVRLGLRELRAGKLMRTWVERRPSANSPTGYAFDRRHSLNSLDAFARRRQRSELERGEGTGSDESIPF